jgi:hypothetical protein
VPLVDPTVVVLVPSGGGAFVSAILIPLGGHLGPGAMKPESWEQRGRLDAFHRRGLRWLVVGALALLAAGVVLIIWDGSGLTHLGPDEGLPQTQDPRSDAGPVRGARQVLGPWMQKTNLLLGGALSRQSRLQGADAMNNNHAGQLRTAQHSTAQC